MAARGGNWGLGEMDGQKVKTSSYRINKSQDGMYSLVPRVSIDNTLSNI